MTSRRLTAALAALVLGSGFAAACGQGSREQPEKSNSGQPPQGGKTVVETGVATLQSTGPAETQVTQSATGP
jgi:hypothetical protein